jgi:2-iminobutanoate/2-iminopropanoate deaminase
MRSVKFVKTKLAPQPVGPYSQGVLAGNLIFVAGQAPIDPKSGKFVLGNIREETELTLRNVNAVLVAGGASLANVVYCTVYLRDLKDFAAMNDVYSRFFSGNYPARATIQAGDLLGGMKIEIAAIAFVPGKK